MGERGGGGWALCARVGVLNGGMSETRMGLWTLLMA